MKNKCFIIDSGSSLLKLSDDEKVYLNTNRSKSYVYR